MSTLINPPSIGGPAVADPSVWTPEMIANAIPMEELVRRIHGGKTPEGYPEPTSATRLGATATQVTNPTAYPYCCCGKFVFRVPEYDFAGYGSAFVVHAKGIMTAAHCVYFPDPFDKSKYRWASSMLFLPAYANGAQSRFGSWEVNRPVSIPKGYTQSDPARRYDYAFCEMKPNSQGQNVGDVVGKILPVNVKSPGSATVLGYPYVGGAHDGNNMWRCTDTVASAANGTQVMKGDMKEGSSGGPWLLQSDPRCVIGLTRGNAGDGASFDSPVFDTTLLEYYEFMFNNGPSPND
jgi:V8-like Glu-specific endopeptidase